MKKNLIILCLSFLLGGCTSTTEQPDIQKLIDEGEYVIVDVRTKEEYEESHIKEAINIPYDEIDENIILDKEVVLEVT